MIFSKNENFNINYHGKVVYIDKFIKHPNPEVTKMKMANVLGFNIIVSNDYESGFYMYFNVGSKLSENFLSKYNLYRDETKNSDSTKKRIF